MHNCCKNFASISNEDQNVISYPIQRIEIAR
jgi:hypothetical protein